MSDNNNHGSAGASQGAAATDLSAGQTTAGAPVAPVDRGNTPPKEALEEQHGEDDKKVGKDTDPAETTKPEQEPAPEANKDWHKEYITFENPDAQAAVDLLKEANVSPIEANAVFEKALQSHDLNDINWDMLTDKVGAAKARLIRNGVEKYYNDVYAVQKATTERVYEMVGGEQAWDSVRKWAQATEKKDPAFKQKLEGIRKAIDVGGYTAEIAVGRLIDMYRSDPKTTGLRSKQVVTGNTAAAHSDETPISRSEYAEKLQEAYRKGDTAAIAVLNRRRMAGKAAGI